MNKINTLAILWTIFFIVSCSKERPIVLGSTSSQELVNRQGNPQEKKGDLLLYPELVSYQVANNVVVGNYRSPTAQERSLNYWKHRWDGNKKIYQVHKLGHQNLLEIQDVETGSSIFYNESTLRVQRVMEFQRDQ